MISLLTCPHSGQVKVDSRTTTVISLYVRNSRWVPGFGGCFGQSLWRCLVRVKSNKSAFRFEVNLGGAHARNFFKRFFDRQGAEVASHVFNFQNSRLRGASEGGGDRQQCQQGKVFDRAHCEIPLEKEGRNLGQREEDNHEGTNNPEH